MIVTRERAKSSFCPLTVNNLNASESKLCKADQCMAWRWHESDEHGEERYGFCGMAGVPEYDDREDQRCADLFKSL